MTRFRRRTRAELHERFADWLEERGADLVELDEILGHHFEQAARYKAELEQAGLRARRTRGRTPRGRRSPRARPRRRPRRGIAARARAHAHAAASPRRPRRGRSRAGSRIRPASGRTRSLSDAAERAAATGDREGEALARVVSASYRLEYEDTVDELDTLAREALPFLEQADDHAGLAHVWNALSEAAEYRGHWGERGQALERAFHHARLAGWQTAHPFDLVQRIHLGSRACGRGAAHTRPADAGAVSSSSSRSFARGCWRCSTDSDEAWPAALEASERCSS